jgi:hypothetical protein
MINLTTYNDAELSLEVFNTEYLYRMISSDDPEQKSLLKVLDDTYTYTKDQLITLLDDISDHVDEWRAENE